MPHTSPDVTPDERDPWLDALLVEDASSHRDAYIDDAGFTAQVMASLPAPAALPRWRKPALAGLWAVAGLGTAYALPGAVLDVTREAFRLLAAQPFSLSGVGTLIAVLGAATWAGTAFALRRD